MSELVDDAIEQLRKLPDNLQAAVARAIIAYAESDDIAGSALDNGGA